MRPRILLVTAQAATVLLTWPLWMARTQGPPLLPILGLPIDFGPWLLATLAVSLVRPGRGAIAHAVVLALAIVADQTRLQPTVISLAVLLLAQDPKRATLAPAHLAALWFWAGAHKLLAPTFATLTAPAVFGAPELGVGLALAEIGLGLLVLAPRARWLATHAALVLHAALATALLARGHLALVPWNLALAGAGLFLPAARDRRLDLALLVIPLGLYAGLTDTYLAHALYTGDVWTTVRCTESACDADVERDRTMAAFGVPLEPEPRLLRAHFDATCAPGEELFLTPPRHSTSSPIALSCPRTD